MIINTKYFVPKGYSAITLFPFILIKNKRNLKNNVLINHEKIHLQQQLELLILFFYLWYIIEFTARLLQHKNWNTAYRNISFEREAYRHECDLEYLKKRPKWAFLKYLYCQKNT